jgi:hypothetical protein
MLPLMAVPFPCNHWSVISFILRSILLLPTCSRVVEGCCAVCVNGLVVMTMMMVVMA